MRRFLFPALLSASIVWLAVLCSAAAQEQPSDDHPAAHHARLSWQEHFAQANLAHDGHLTLDEAKAGYPSISRHFHAIDVDGRGFVTENDVRAWMALRKAARKHPHEATTDPLRPRNAFHLRSIAQPPMNTDTKQTVTVPRDGPQGPKPLRAPQPTPEPSESDP
jgi:hypothetical protein